MELAHGGVAGGLGLALAGELAELLAEFVVLAEDVLVLEVTTGLF